MIRSRSRRAPASDPTTLVHPHPGAQAVYDPDDGAIVIGIHADGRPARWRLFHPKYGLASGLIVGDTGAGTSVLVANIAITAAHTGVLSVWSANLSGGPLSAALSHTPWAAASPQTIRAQIEDIERLVKTRLALNVTRRRAVHIPTPDEPGVLLVVEDIYELFTRRMRGTSLDLANRLARIVSDGPKVAVGIVMATPTGRLVDFGGNHHLRIRLAGQNLAALRTAGPLDLPVRGLLPADLRALPHDLPGVGYLPSNVTRFRGWLPTHDTYAEFTHALELDPFTTRSRVAR